jgi:hypothetical protein
MKKTLFLAILLAATACSKTTTAEQQTPDSTQQDSAKSVKTFQGQVLQKIEIYDPSASMEMVGIVVQTDQGTIPVILGPRCFVAGGPELTNQPITVKGVEVHNDGTTFVVAHEAETEGYVLKLRNSEGVPLWSGWHQKS